MITHWKSVEGALPTRGSGATSRAIQFASALSTSGALLDDAAGNLAGLHRTGRTTCASYLHGRAACVRHRRGISPRPSEPDQSWPASDQRIGKPILAAHLA